jgi:anti-sigma factor ChrR (cupin superfamily)
MNVPRYAESPSLIFPQLAQMVSSPETLAWEPFRPGIAIYQLYVPSPSSSAAALLRYDPGASVPWHRHVGYEHIWVLSGSQQDDRGVYAAGTLVINPPDTCHQVSSPDGCIVLAIWEKPVQFEALSSFTQTLS